MSEICLQEQQRKRFETTLQIGILKDLCEAGLLSAGQLQRAIQQVNARNAASLSEKAV